MSLQSPHTGESSKADAQRPRVFELVQKHGIAANSFQILEPDYTYWFHRSDDGRESVVAYVQAAGFLVVASGPVGPKDCIAETMLAFADFATEKRSKLLLVGIEPWIVESMGSNVDAFDVFKIGEQPEWDTSRYHLQGPERRSLRGQVNRAMNKGVKVRRVGSEELERAPGSLRLEIEHILGRWRDSRRIAVLRFMVNLEPFTFSGQRRYYVAEHGHHPVGFLAAVPVYGRNGWFLEDVIRVPDAPNGTSELLIHHAILDAQANGEDFLTLGLSPLTGIEGGPGEHRFLRWGLRQTSRRMGSLYGFEGLRAFKARLHPDRWVPQFALMSRKASSFGAAWALFSAFAPGPLRSFLYDSLRRLLRRVSNRVWTTLLVIQLSILVPWTVLLSLADGRQWFGDPSIQTAWVAFDTVLAIFLSVLAYLLWSGHSAARRVSMFLAGATLTDFVLSTTQAVQLHSAVSGWSSFFVTLGVTGPAVATLCLWCIAIAGPGTQER